MDEGLTLDALTIRHSGRPLVQVTAHVAPGEVLTVMGPSGSGKSTLLSCIMGDMAAAFTATGRILLDSHDLTPLPPDQRRIGVLYQDPLLFPHLSVAANLAFGLPRGTHRATRRQQVDQALADVALDGFGPRDPSTLSGGQAARVALMRVLLSRPKALLLDEPFSKLDSGLRGQIRTLVFERATSAGIPVLLVTHDLADAQAAGGPIIRLGADET